MGNTIAKQFLQTKTHGDDVKQKHGGQFVIVLFPVGMNGNIEGPLYL